MRGNCNYVYIIYLGLITFTLFMLYGRSTYGERKLINSHGASNSFSLPSSLPPPPCFSMHRLINRGEKEIAIMHVRMRRNGGHASYNISERRERASLPSGQEKQVVSK